MYVHRVTRCKCMYSDGTITIEIIHKHALECFPYNSVNIDKVKTTTNRINYPYSYSFTSNCRHKIVRSITKLLLNVFVK